MSARESTYLEVYPLRYRLRARAAIVLPRGEAANILRGSFGKVLRREDAEAYRRYFAPVAAEGPSGLRDAPRPFVLRAAALEGATFGIGDELEIGVNLFQLRDPPLELFRRVIAGMLPADVVGVEGNEALRLSLDAVVPSVRRVRVRFVTPTELKGAGRPEFAILFARIRDRVSNLRAMYGAGPLAIDFKAMGERACGVAMTRCEIERVEGERQSRNTGQTHPLGGFIGVAEYEGELAEFVPYLEAARYTGVGRQTVWGKGEIGFEIF